MYKPTKGNEFCTVGAGYRIHVRSIGSRLAKCGSANRRTPSQGLKMSRFDETDLRYQGQWTMCENCKIHTTEI